MIGQFTAQLRADEDVLPFRLAMMNDSVGCRETFGATPAVIRAAQGRNRRCRGHHQLRPPYPLGEGSGEVSVTMPITAAAAGRAGAAGMTWAGVGAPRHQASSNTAAADSAPRTATRPSSMSPIRVASTLRRAAGSSLGSTSV